MATDTLPSLATASFEGSPPHRVVPTPREAPIGNGPTGSAAGSGGQGPGEAGQTRDEDEIAVATNRHHDDGQIALATGPHRDEIIKRLRRAEGQLRGIVRMLEEGQGCLPISQQLTAVRKALDATMARMTVSYLEQELADDARRDPAVGRAIERVGLLIGRLG
ncbi:MAG: metal-sensing transcriptional repressor [Burkholderiaceae bacterium]